jgi:AmiR/NasT family two-component response regulator
VRRLANIAVTTLVLKGALSSTSERAEQLEVALTTRIAIEQAKGYLAARLDIGVDEAFLRLRAFCRDRNLPLWRIARELVDGSLAVSEQLRLITGR